MRWLILSVVISSSLFLFAKPGQADGELTITISNKAFVVEPAGLLESGKLQGPLALTWVNNDSVAHDIVSDRFPTLRTGVLQPGESMTFELASIEKFGCAIHPEMRIPIFPFRDQFPLPTESPFYRHALQLDRFLPGDDHPRPRCIRQ